METARNILYTSLFVTDPKGLLEKFTPKHSKIFAHHSTIDFNPASLEGINVGEVSKIKVIGRAFDEKGDALLVENKKSKNEFPHITISCAEGTGAKYSNELLQKAVANKTLEYLPPFFIEVVEGYETRDGKVFPESISSSNTSK